MTTLHQSAVAQNEEQVARRWKGGVGAPTSAFIAKCADTLCNYAWIALFLPAPMEALKGIKRLTCPLCGHAKPVVGYPRDLTPRARAHLLEIIAPDIQAALDEGGDGAAQEHSGGPLEIITGQLRFPSDFEEHDGGPCPVDPGSRVTIMTRDGGFKNFERAATVVWQYGTYIAEINGPLPLLAQVVAYRVRKEAK